MFDWKQRNTLIEAKKREKEKKMGLEPEEKKGEKKNKRFRGNISGSGQVVDGDLVGDISGSNNTIRGDLHGNLSGVDNTVHGKVYGSVSGVGNRALRGIFIARPRPMVSHKFIVVGDVDTDSGSDYEEEAKKDKDKSPKIKKVGSGGSITKHNFSGATIGNIQNGDNPIAYLGDFNVGFANPPMGISPGVPGHNIGLGKLSDYPMGIPGYMHWNSGQNVFIQNGGFGNMQGNGNTFTVMTNNDIPPMLPPQKKKVLCENFPQVPESSWLDTTKDEGNCFICEDMIGLWSILCKGGTLHQDALCYFHAKEYAIKEEPSCPFCGDGVKIESLSKIKLVKKET